MFCVESVAGVFRLWGLSFLYCLSALFFPSICLASVSLEVRLSLLCAELGHISFDSPISCWLKVGGDYAEDSQRLREINGLPKVAQPGSRGCLDLNPSL